MNTKILLGTTSVLLAMLGGTMTQASAQVMSKTTTNNNISFELSGNVVDPVDPTDPSKPLEKPDPEDPNNTGTGNKGPLSIDYISNFNFGTNNIPEVKTTYEATNTNPYIQITDSRGTGQGYTLKANPHEFKTKDGDVLEGAYMTIAGGQVVSSGVGKEPLSNDVRLVPGQSYTVMWAQQGAGKGTWVEKLFGKNAHLGDKGNLVGLVVPAGTAKAESYTSTIDWSLENVPMA